VIESLCRRRVDGLIVEPIGADTPYLKAEIEAGLPVVRSTGRDGHRHRPDHQ
jgi:LacI family transcriptional regulator